MLTPRRARTLFLILILATGLLAILASPAPTLIPKVAAAFLTVTLTSPIAGGPPTHAHVGQVVTFTANGVTASVPDGTACTVSGAPSNVVTNVKGEVRQTVNTGYGAFTIGTGPANTGGGAYTLTVFCGPDSGTATLIIDPFMTLSAAGSVAGQQAFGFTNTQVSVTVNGFPSDATGPCTITSTPAGVVKNSPRTCTISGGTATGTFTANPENTAHGGSSPFGVNDTVGGYAINVNVFGGICGASCTATFFLSSGTLPAFMLAMSQTHAPALYGTTGGPITITGGGFGKAPGPGQLGPARTCSVAVTAGTLFFANPSLNCQITANGTLTSSFAVTTVPLGGPSYTIKVFDNTLVGSPCNAGCAISGSSPNFAVDLSPGALFSITPTHDVAGKFIFIPPAAGNPNNPFGGTVANSGADAGACILSQSPTSPALFSSTFCLVDNAGNVLIASFVVANTAPNQAYTIQITPVHGDISGNSPTFHPDPAITLSQTFGSPAIGAIPATTVTITGTGFLVTDTGTCTISWTGSGAGVPPLVKAVPTCNIPVGTGQVSAQFVVDSGALDRGTGGYTITVTGQPGSDAPTSATPFTVLPVIAVTPTSGNGGAVILVSGAGFASGGGAGSPCVPAQIVTIPNGLASTSSCTENNDGTVTGSFTVDPASLNGQYTIKVTGTGGVTDTASFSPFTRGTSGGTGCAPGCNVFLSPNIGGLGTTVIVTGTGFSSSDNGCTITSLPILPTASPMACTMSAGGVVNGVFTINGQPSPGITLIQVTGTIGGSVNDFGVAYFSVPYLVLTTVTSTSTSTTLTSTSFSTLTTTTNLFSTLTTTTLSTTARSTETDIAYTYLTLTGQATNFLTMLETATSTSTFLSTTMVTTTVASSTITVTVSGFVVRAQQSLGTPDGLGVLALLLLFVPLVVRRFYD